MERHLEHSICGNAPRSRDSRFAGPAPLPLPLLLLLSLPTLLPPLTEAAVGCGGPSGERFTRLRRDSSGGCSRFGELLGLNTGGSSAAVHGTGSGL